jgi:transposase-like protein
MQEVKIKNGGSFSESERRQIIEEYLNSEASKSAIWKKYTGQNEEHGHLRRWMYQLGYEDKYVKRAIFVTQPEVILPQEHLNIDGLSHEELQNELIKLKKQLEEAQIKAEGYNLMIDYAEKEFKIPIRKKPSTK